MKIKLGLWVLEFKYPRYDVIKRKVCDAENGTLLWGHERRHKEQHDQDWFTICFLLSYKISVFFIILSFISSLFFAQNVTNTFLALAAGTPTTLFGFLELDAWAHAHKLRYKGG